MNSTEAFHACNYVCPECQTKNTVRTSNNPYLRKGFNCKKCKKKWTIGQLCEIYGFHTKLIIDQCAEFYCENCGEQNVAVGTYFEQKIYDQEQEMTVDVFQEPQQAICENCQTKQKLIYPIHEENEQKIIEIDESKIPHEIVWIELTPEEEEIWAKEQEQEEET